VVAALEDLHLAAQCLALLAEIQYSEQPLQVAAAILEVGTIYQLATEAVVVVVEAPLLQAIELV
jgi:hypothetical protein